MKRFLFYILSATVAATASYFIFSDNPLPAPSADTQNTNGTAYITQINIPPSAKPAPEKVKAIHLAYGAYLHPSFPEILKQVENSQINSIIFEIKNPSGWVALDSERHIAVLKELLPKLSRGGIHTTARMVLFQDPVLAEENPALAIGNSATGGAWADRKGIVWIDATQREAWDYNIEIARRAAALGFDEVNFDYVRFPTDGNLSLTKYANLQEFGTKENAIASFLKYARRQLGPNVTLSIDVFGMTFLNDQLVIGQAVSKMAPHVDVVYPMPYPSHFPDGFQGYANPAEHPYEILDYTLKKGAPKMEGTGAIVRPWLQDFDLGAVYGPDKIQAQIRAAEDNGINTWALWNASNRYTWSAVR